MGYLRVLFGVFLLPVWVFSGCSTDIPDGSEFVSHFTFMEADGRVLSIEPAAEVDLQVRWFYDPNPVEGGPYQVSIDGKPFPLSPAGIVFPAYYARFQVREPFTMDIEVDLPEGHSIQLQPRRYQDDLLVGENGKLSLEIKEAGQRVFMLKSEEGDLHTPLIILAEPCKSWKVIDADDPREFVNVSHLANLGPENPQTGAIQEALDAVAESKEGGTVYFGPGEYYTGHLVVGSNTRVFLAPGTVIYGHADLNSYYQPDGMVLFLFDNADNSGLDGPGVIDGNGYSIQQIEEERTSIHLVRFRDSRNMYAQNVMMRNSVAWTFHILGCDDVDVDGLRVIGDWGLPNVDGIDPDNSRNVQIVNTFVYASDDAVVVKTSGRYGISGPSENIEIRDSVVMTLKTALKLGTESRDNISNVLFDNIDVIFSSRGVAAWMRDGHDYSDITWRNIRMDLYEFPGESMSGEPFRFTIEDRNGVGNIRNVLLENIDVSAPYRARFTGREGGQFENIKLSNINWKVTPARIKTPPDPVTSGLIVDSGNELPVDGRPLMQVHRVKNLKVDKVTIDWLEAPDSWDRFLDIQASDNIQLDKVSHTGYPF